MDSNNEKLLEKNTLETDLESIGSETLLLEEKDKLNLQFLGRYALTGFVIDSLNKILIFLEGCSSSGLQDIWHTIMRLPQSKGKTLYNSSLCFEKKLYGDFLNFGGILMITLQEPLDKHLVTYTSYLRGNIPAPCWQCTDPCMREYTQYEEGCVEECPVFKLRGDMSSEHRWDAPDGNVTEEVDVSYSNTTTGLEQEAMDVSVNQPLGHYYLWLKFSSSGVRWT
uniref:Uncharacterized protein n=1 Tax=Timema cristinae TaxID=61476 RepID=A0A7R9CZL4_TIMCR|nr:unnamed protein product [Timema cristinae]